MGRRVVALGLGGVLMLSGCGVMEAGQAAVSDEFRVSQGQVDAEVRLVLEALGQPSGQPLEGLARATTQRLVQDALFQAKAAELGVEVTPAQVQTGLEELAAQQGGQEALEQAALRSGIPPQALEDFVRTQLLFTGIGEELDYAADASAPAQLVQDEMVAFSEAIDVRVAPRYGAWDDTTLTIVPGSSPVRTPTESVEP